MSNLPAIADVSLYPLPSSLFDLEDELQMCLAGSDLLTERGLKILLYIKENGLFKEKGFSSFDTYLKELPMPKKVRTVYSMMRRYQLLEQLDIGWNSHELDGKIGQIDGVLKHANVTRNHEFIEEEIPGTINKEKTKELVEQVIDGVPFPQIERDIMILTNKSEGRFNIRAKEVVPNKFKLFLSYLSPDGIVYFSDEFPEWVIQKLASKLHTIPEWLNLESKI